VKTEDMGPEKRRRRRNLDGPAVVAHITEDDQHAEVRHAAEVHAKAHGCVLILYAADAASLWADPMPNEWDSDGELERFGDRLSPEDLDFLGRSAIAGQVREGQGSGAKSSAWLPKDKGIEALAVYAAAQRAHLIFVPASLDSIDALGRLLAAGPDTGATVTPVSLQIVPGINDSTTR
jgi:hypothetical protein